MKKLVVLVLCFINIFANVNIQNDEKLILSPGETIVIDGDLNIQNNSVFEANYNTSIYISDDFNNFGSFKASTSTINFTDSDDLVTQSNIMGNNKFYSFYSDMSLKFQSSTTQIFENSLILKSSNGKSLIHTSNEDVQTIFDLSNRPNINVSSLQIQDIKNVGILSPLKPSNSEDLGNTYLWFENDSKTEYCVDNNENNLNTFNTQTCRDLEDSTETIKYVSNDSNEVKTEIIVPVDIVLDISRNENSKTTSLVYHDDTQGVCGINAIVKLIDNGEATTGFINENGCDEYLDPTIQNFESIKSESKVYILKANEEEQKNHPGAKSIIVLDINLTKSIIIGGR